MKNNIRIFAIDDSPFRFSDKDTYAVGVICRLPVYIEGINIFSVDVDGNDSTEKIISVVNQSRFKENIKAIIVNGIALAGFNVIDIASIYAKTDIPVVTVSRKIPDMNTIKKTLEKKFIDWKDKWKLIKKNEIHIMERGVHRLSFSYIGIEEKNARDLIEKSIYKGNYPEALRIAHIIASAIKKGESKGKA
ncbi:MAG: DUF99 family protein [Thermoplasmata archaeon]